MGFTFKNAVGALAASDTCSATLTGTSVTAGDLIVAWCGWATDVGAWSFGDNVTPSYFGAALNTGGPWSAANGQFFYKIASVATGLPTYTFTATGSSFPGFIVNIFTPTGTVTYDNGLATAQSFPGSTSVSSGAFTAGAGDTLCIGGMMCENDGTPLTSRAIGGGSATTNAQEFFDGSLSHATWYLATSGSVSATATLNASQKWLANAISFTNLLGSGSTVVTSSSIIRVPGARRTMIIPG